MIVPEVRNPHCRGAVCERVQKILLTALLFSAVQTTAGVTYEFRSVTSGVKKTTLAGVAKIDGGRFRIDLSTGDGLLFHDNAVVLSPDSGKTLHVLDPKAQTYYELRLDDLLGEVSALLKQFGSSVAVTNERVRARDAGSGGTIEGYATRRHVVDTSCQVVLKALGETFPVDVRMTSQSWSAPQLPGEWMNVFQIQGVKTGIAGLDRLIAAQSATTRGFPLKQITTTRMTQRGLEMTSTTTATVSGLRMMSFPPATFVLPAGWKKVDSPITRLTKRPR